MADANSGPHFPDFHRALTIWAESAVPLNNAQGLIEESRIRWVSSGENRRTSVYAPLLRWKRTDTANELTEWSTVVESASAEPIISRHLEGAVGTREYGAFPIDLRVFAEFCLAPFVPKYQDGRIVAIPFDQASFSARYSLLEEFLLSSTLRYVSWTLIVGLKALDNAVSLGNGVSIENLRDEEIEEWGFRGFIQSSPLLRDYYVHDLAPRCVFRREQLLDKVVGEFGKITYGSAQSDRLTMAGLLHERFLNSIALASSARVFFASTREQCVSFPLGELSRAVSYDVVRVQDTTLSPDDIAQLQRLWRRLGEDVDSSLQLALRRVTYSMQRTRDEDNILDLLIAAEAMLLSDAGTSELKYRFALRGSWYAESETGSSRRSVFEFLKNAYDVRSDIAHGGRPKPAKLVIDGNRVSLAAFVEHLSQMIKNMLKRALVGVDARDRLPRSWDDDLVGVSS